MSELAKDATTTKPAGPRRRAHRRLAPHERESAILEEAVRFFAEVGFGGQTRELAQRLGVTQPLLYRYFPTKQHLIDRVYDTVFLERWDRAWSAILADRTRPLRDRLITVYRAYTASVFTYEWMRIYMFAALRGAEFNRRYTKLIETELLWPICTEIRASTGLADFDVVAGSERELELAWNMHAGIFYYFVRKFIYQTRVEADIDAVIVQSVDAMLEGAPALARRLVATD